MAIPFDNVQTSSLSISRTAEMPTGVDAIDLTITGLDGSVSFTCVKVDALRAAIATVLA